MRKRPLIENGMKKHPVFSMIGNEQSIEKNGEYSCSICYDGKGGERMQIRIEVDDSITETEVIIRAAQMTEEVNGIVKRISDEKPQMLSGFREGELEILEQAKIIRVYAAAGKVYAVTQEGEYTMRLRLYEMEERLDKNSFVRISNSEIINLKMAKRFDLSFAGTICVTMANGASAYVSRRYVSRIKHLLGI